MPDLVWLSTTSLCSYPVVYGKSPQGNGPPATNFPFQVHCPLCRYSSGSLFAMPLTCIFVSAGLSLSKCGEKSGRFDILSLPIVNIKTNNAAL